MTKLRLQSISILMIYLIFSLSIFDANLLSQDYLRGSNQVKKETIIEIAGYPLSSGDAISIFAGLDSTFFLNNRYVIDDKGVIDLPIKGKVNLKNLNEDRFKNMLVDFYQKELVYQQLQIKPLIRIGMVGGFERPGFYYVDPSSSFWQLLERSGSPLERKLFEDAVLRRGHQKFDFKIYEQIEKSNSIASMGLVSGDVIEIPSPEERSTWERVRDYLPIITSITAVVSIYYSYQLSTRVTR